MDRSLHVVDNDGEEHAFPTLDDLVNEIPGLLLDDGSYDPDLASQAFMLWFRGGQSACLFARQMAQDPVAADWLLACVPRPITDDQLQNVLRSTVGAHRAATQVTFPYAQSADEVGALVAQIARLDDWSCERVGDEPNESITRVGLRWSGVADGHVAWALGFAPLDTMPRTRRAPFSAIILRTQDEYHIERKHDPPHTEVHLADLCKPEEIDQGQWTKTREKRAALVEPDLQHCAKAKVSFSLPSSAAAAAGLQ